MGKKANGYTAQQFIDKIPGSGGIISTIAKRIGTVNAWVKHEHWQAEV